MEKIFKLKTFWVTFIAASAAAFLAILNMSGGYVSRAEIMIVPKSVEAIKNSNQIIENLRELPLTLSFYDKVTTADSDLENDTVKELPDAKRKAYWNSVMSVKRVSDSGILVLEDRSQDMFFADNLNKQSVETFIGSIGLYYDIKNDIDVRIVDPTVTQYVRGFNGRLFAELVAGAFLMVFLVFWIVAWLFENLSAPHVARPQFSFPYKSTDFPGWPLKMNGKEKTKESKDTKDTKEKKQEIFPLTEEVFQEEPYIDFGRTGAAPANLPVAEADSFPTQGPEMKSEEAEEKKDETPLTHEATPEEVKERLNKLLSGKL